MWTSANSAGDRVDVVGIDAETLIGGQGFSGELQQNRLKTASTWNLRVQSSRLLRCKVQIQVLGCLCKL